MSKNIVAGKLVEMSPSMIVAFDASTSFGCEQRAVFRHVMGLKEDQNAGQELGDKVHNLIEERMITGKVPAGEGEAFGLYLAGQAMIEQVAARQIVGVELVMPRFEIAGVPINHSQRNKKFMSRGDVVTSDGVIDWKTSSNPSRYGKTAAQLATDTQMVIYGKAFHPNLPSVKLAHGYFQTKGRKTTDFVEVEVTQEHLDAHIEKVIVPKVERMKVLAADPEQAVRDFKKCFNCTFRPRCPTPGAETVMGFFTKVINKDTASVSAGSLLNDGSFAASPKVTPPDAPASKPELAADPVAGFDPLPPKKSMKTVDVEPEKVQVVAAMDKSAAEYSQKRGRPPGAKNKPKNEPLSDTPAGRMEEVIEKFEKGEVSIEQARKLLEPAERRFESVSVSLGVTVNVGNFNSVRFDVSVTSKEHTYEEVYAEVKRRLDAEAAKYEAEIAKDKKVNGKEIVK